MPDSVYYFLLAFLSLLFFTLGLLIGRGGRKRAIATYLVLLILLLTKAVLNHNPDWEFALFSWPNYIFFQSWLVYPFGLICLGLAIGLLPPGRNRKAVCVMAAFCFVVSLWTERWIVVEPETSEARATANHHCEQTMSYTCGPAACVSLLSYLGVDVSEGEMMRLCKTPRWGGTSLFRICRGLRLKLPRREYDVRIVDGDPAGLRGLGTPAIVSVKKLHVVTVRFEKEHVVVHDPALKRPEQMSYEKYSDEYGGTAVIVEPRSNGVAAGG